MANWQTMKREMMAGMGMPPVIALRVIWHDE